ncbi:MAG: hypothetical protein R3B84_13490 [Zavarzinella sp.]
MAEDWIKMRTDLYRDPKVCLMADLLMADGFDSDRNICNVTRNGANVTRNVFRNAVVGGLVTVWGTFRHRGKREGDNLIFTYGNSDILDDIADLPGFGAAMVAVGWLVIVDNRLVFPNFFSDYNSEVKPASLAKSNAQRQAEYRARKAVSGNNDDPQKRVTNVTLRNDREEKSREEKSKENTPPIPPEGGDGEFESFWNSYPKKTGKKAALSEWLNLAPTPELVARILADLAQRCQSQAWTNDDGRWIPNPAKYIQEERWNDEQPTRKATKPISNEAANEAFRMQEEYLRERSRHLNIRKPDDSAET